MSSFNPFAALIEEKSEQPKPNPTPIKKNISFLLEEIFGFTLDKSRSEKNQLLHLEEVANTFNRTDLDVEILEHALFDRLFMCNEEDITIKNAKRTFHNKHACESKVVTYLFNCYTNINEINGLSEEERRKVKVLVIQNAVTAYIQSEIYHGQKLHAQLVDILKEALPYYDNFFKDICKGILEEDNGGNTKSRLAL